MILRIMENRNRLQISSYEFHYGMIASFSFSIFEKRRASEIQRLLFENTLNYDMNEL